MISTRLGFFTGCLSSNAASALVASFANEELCSMFGSVSRSGESEMTSSMILSSKETLILVS